MSVVKLPSNGSPGLAMEVASRKVAQSSLFLELEAPICDAAHMAGIVGDLIAEAHDRDQLDEQTAWAALQLCQMVKDLRDQYRERPDEGGTTS
jgi:hypothetical protein